MGNECRWLSGQGNGARWGMSAGGHGVEGTARGGERVRVATGSRERRCTVICDNLGDNKTGAASSCPLKLQKMVIDLANLNIF